jgi:hypothetical protein
MSCAPCFDGRSDSGGIEMHWYDDSRREDFYEVEFTQIRKGTLYVMASDADDVHEEANKHLEYMNAEELDREYGEGDFQLGDLAKVPDEDPDQLRLFRSKQDRRKG